MVEVVSMVFVAIWTADANVHDPSLKYVQKHDLRKVNPLFL